jgi:malonyl-CoA O-methyltransferase
MDLYREWAATYPAHAHNRLMEVEQATVLSLLPPVAGRRVLDAGCGTGRYVQLLTFLGARVVGVDRSAAMIGRTPRGASSVVRADMHALPIATAACELVVSGLAVVDIADLGAVLAEWSRVLARRGVTVYSTLHPRGRDLGWWRTYDRDGMIRTLPAHWHTPADHRRACRQAGLEIEATAEPALERGGLPVALVIRARKRW